MANHVALIEQMRLWADTLERDVPRAFGPHGVERHDVIRRVVAGLRQTADDLERGDTEDAQEGVPNESHP